LNDCALHFLFLLPPITLMVPRDVKPNRAGCGSPAIERFAKAAGLAREAED
jgi:hypothetical protein